MLIQSKIETLKNKFSDLSSTESLYQEIMALGKDLPSFNSEWKKEENRVLGCQSLMYLASFYREGKLFFYATSDALISAGLAALLLEVYSGQSPEVILKTSPSFLEEMKIPAALTPGRANGLASLVIKMKQEALKHLLQKA